MNEQTMVMDPELRAFLAEVAAQGRSSLLDVELGERHVNALYDVPTASAGTAGWTAAERHLLQAHREEVAHLLRNAFRVKIATENTCHAIIEHGPGHLQDEAQVQEASNRAKRRDRHFREDTGLLDELLAGRLHRIGYSELTTAAMRLVGSDVDHLLHAAARITEGDPESVLDGLAEIQASGGSMSFFASLSLGMALSALGRHDQALTSYEAGVNMRPEHVAASAFTLLEALLAGDQEAASRYARHLAGNAVAFPDEARGLEALWTRITPLAGMDLPLPEEVPEPTRRILDVGR